MAAHGELIHITGAGSLGTNDPRAWLDGICGHCGRVVNAAVVAFTQNDGGIPISRWTRCTNCGHGSYVAPDGRNFPGPRIGRDVEGLPDLVAEAYAEARDCACVNAFTACEMTCRSILMHIAVDKGANQRGTTFKGFINYLEQHNHVTPAMKPWVDVIRKHGNIAVHELPHTDAERALGTLTFTEHLLRNVYEMEHLARRFAPKADDIEQSSV